MRPKTHKKKPLCDRFWQSVETGLPAGGCWPWKRSVNADGYGQICVNGRTQRAHRVAWSLHHGRPVPEDMCVLHSCDNPRCCNPAHLSLGTVPQNNADMVAKNRHQRGDSGSGSKLTSQQVRLIRESSLPCAELGRAMGVSKGTISRARRSESWAHIKSLSQPAQGEGKTEAEDELIDTVVDLAPTGLNCRAVAKAIAAVVAERAKGREQSPT